jgi:hypothetical protein
MPIIALQALFNAVLLELIGLGSRIGMDPSAKVCRGCEAVQVNKVCSMLHNTHKSPTLRRLSRKFG